ncbi:MAG: nitrate- and nitrite sensing domain-containing protein, partial [Acidimicrobiia bacterium]
MLRSAQRARARPQSGSTASGGPPAAARTRRGRAESLISLLLAAVLVAGACAHPASPDEVLGPRAVRTQAVAVARLSGLVLAVQLERSAASVEVLDMEGMEGVVALPADSTEARRQTDAAIAEFTATLAEDDPIAAAYRPAAGALAQLETLRRDIDAGEAPRNQSNL